MARRQRPDAAWPRQPFVKTLMAETFTIDLASEAEATLGGLTRALAEKSGIPIEQMRLTF